MYIIGGKLKGRKLANPKSKSIRPAMALIRKSIFDTLQDFTTSTNVLDLCAGTGVLGIEALSRNAESLTLIDSDRNACKLIQKNLELCNIKANVILGKLPESLKRISSVTKKFDLIFLDPPYGQSEFIEDVLKNIISKNLISKNGIISIESEAKSNFKIPDELKIFKEKRFGNTKITILHKV